MVTSHVTSSVLFVLLVLLVIYVYFLNHELLHVIIHTICQLWVSCLHTGHVRSIKSLIPKLTFNFIRFLFLKLHWECLVNNKSKNTNNQSINQSTTLFQQGSPLSSTADIQRGPAS